MPIDIEMVSMMNQFERSFGPRSWSEPVLVPVNLMLLLFDFDPHQLRESRISSQLTSTLQGAFLPPHRGTSSMMFLLDYTAGRFRDRPFFLQVTAYFPLPHGQT